MRPLHHALPGALADLLRGMPLSDGKVDFAWRTAVGTKFERVTSARLEGRVLFVTATDQRWAREITRSSGLILARLHTLLGQEAVTRLAVLSPKTFTK